MEITVKGKNEKLAKAEAKFATNYYLNMLLKKSIVENLIVAIKFSKLSEKGLCSPEDDDDNDLPREFIIEIDNRMSKPEQLRTLAHECVHLKSFSTGELKYSKHANCMLWKRKKVYLDKIDYWDLPSEIEAFGREVGLYVRYLDHKKEMNLKFLSPSEKRK